MQGPDFSHLGRDVAIGAVLCALAGWGIGSGVVALCHWVSAHLQWAP